MCNVPTNSSLHGLSRCTPVVLMTGKWALSDLCAPVKLQPACIRQNHAHNREYLPAWVHGNVL